jgi:hypothetical protein
MSLTKLSLAVNNLIIPGRPGQGIVNLFLQCDEFVLRHDPFLSLSYHIPENGYWDVLLVLFT